MAAITDLTWQELLDQLPANAIVVTNNKVLIDASVFTGLTIDSLSDEGVMSFAYKLMRALRKAQDVANEDVTDEEALRSFAGGTYGPINTDSGKSQVTFRTEFYVQIDPNNIAGYNA